MAKDPEPRQERSDELRELWKGLDPRERADAFEKLDREEAAALFVQLEDHERAQIVGRLDGREQRLWLRLLPPDDAADVLQEVGDEQREEWIELLDEPTRREVTALLAYAEEEAGGIMNPRFAQVPPDMTVDGAIRYLQQQTRQHLETIYYVYVIDEDQRLRGVVSLRELFQADSSARVRDVMIEDVVKVPEEMDQEEVAHLLDVHDLIALPVVDEEDRIQGIVTFDDIVDVVREEATEDVQKIGGMEALQTPYLDASLWQIVKKRGGWLALLFLGLLMTATAIEAYEEALANAVVLTAFIRFIIASGGNSGAQASTLVVRALAVGDVRLGDWWRVLGRECLAGLFLGSMLAAIGFARVFGWELAFGVYGEHAALLALTVGISLLGVVIWGTLAGAILPFILEKLDFDPASASVPLLTTIVDVSGLLIYFNVAKIVLSGTLL